MRKDLIQTWLVIMVMGCSFSWAEPPKGNSVEPTAAEATALSSLQGKINGKIVWSTSRNGNHDLYVMNADGTNKRPLTQSVKTDWFSRFSPDGARVIFMRSKMDWTIESDADKFKLWDVWIINTDGTGEELLIPDATWPTWRPNGKNIVFARGTRIYVYDMEKKREILVCDSENPTHGFRKAAILQNPHMSPDGKHLAITLRGKMRETGIWDITAKKWTPHGPGCQLNWFPSGRKMVKIHPTGKGGNQIVQFAVENGKPLNPKASVKDMALMDLPGRRSHEYFPEISSDERWLMWAATARGHDHDTEDYEVYIWELGTSQDQAVRVTFHTGNDRWPDIHLF